MYGGLAKLGVPPKGHEADFYVIVSRVAGPVFSRPADDEADRDEFLFVAHCLRDSRTIVAGSGWVEHPFGDLFYRVLVAWGNVMDLAYRGRFGSTPEVYPADVIGSPALREFLATSSSSFVDALLPARPDSWEPTGVSQAIAYLESELRGNEPSIIKYLEGSVPLASSFYPAGWSLDSGELLDMTGDPVLVREILGQALSDGDGDPTTGEDERDLQDSDEPDGDESIRLDLVARSGSLESSEDDPAQISTVLVLLTSNLLVTPLGIDPDYFPAADAASSEQGRALFAAAHRGGRGADAAIFLAHAYLRYLHCELDRLKVEGQSQEGGVTYREALRRLNQTFPLTPEDEVRLAQCDAPYRAFDVGEVGDLDSVDGYPTPQLPILAFKLHGVDPNDRNQLQTLEGSRRAASGHFTMEALKHTVHIVLGDGFSDIESDLLGFGLFTPLDFTLHVTETWARDGEIIRGFASDLVHRAAEEATPPSTSGPVPSTVSSDLSAEDVGNRLRELTRLRDEGILEEDEFKRKKAELLDRL